MTPNKEEAQTIALINGYRARMAIMCQPVKVVLALVSLGGEYPKGTCLAWGLLRGYVEARQEQMTKPEQWEIIEIHPDQEIEA